MKDVINVASRLDEVGNIMPRCVGVVVQHEYGLFGFGDRGIEVLNSHGLDAPTVVVRLLQSEYPRRHTHTHGDGQRRHGAYRPAGSGDGGAERGGCHGRPAMDATHEIRQLSSAELS